MPKTAPTKWRYLIALSVLLGGAMALPLNAAAADLRGMLAAQAADDNTQEAETFQPTDQLADQSADQPAGETEDGFFNNLSDFLGDGQQPAEAEAPLEGDWAEEAGFGADPDEDAYAAEAGTHYEGQALEPEASDMFDDAFGNDTVRGTREGEEGPAADDAPEDFTQGGEVETQQLDAPNGEMDIFGRPKDGSTPVDEAAVKEDDGFKLDLFNLPPVDFKVPRNATVTVRALDKITARMSEHKLKVNTPYMFGTLAIVMRTCVKNPPEEEPEVKAFLQIADNRPEMENKAWFSGWMFASSPAISALEHPVYDVWVIDCNIVSASADEDNL